MTGAQKAVVVVLTIAALSTVAIAAAVDSAVPLFFAWLPQLAIIVFLSRTDRRVDASAEERSRAS